MKKRTNLIYAFLIITLFLSVRLPAQEMVIINDTIEWTMESTHGYYFFQPPESTPSNWLSPDNYYNGEFYTRYEILSEATSEPCGLQVGIWQWRLESNIQDGQKDYSEIMASIVSMNGPGSVEIAHSAPNTWWRSYEGVDFSRVYDFWRLGINIWSLDPRSVIASSNWGGSNEIWAERDKWFPIRVYVTVVAVAQGHSFSGWENYIDNKPPTPAFTIDFVNETTAENIPATVRYSLSGDMSGAVSGSNEPVTLVPGQDVYFQVMAAGGLPASDIQHLVVPDRPGMPSFTYDGANERTAQTVSAEYEFATDPAMSDAVTGTGTYVSFPVGTTRYFRKKATSVSFSSYIQALEGSAIPTPAYTIDYMNERTGTPVPAEDEYSYDNFSSDGVSGSGEYLNLVPGQDVYFRTKPQGGDPASAIQHLIVPPRPSTPAFTIDFAGETTAETVSQEIEYSESSSFTVSSTGNNEPLALEPGSLLYFRVKHTGSSFRSQTQVLNIPQRPILTGIDASDTISESPFTLHAIFPGPVTGFGLEDLEVTNGTLSNLQGTYEFDFSVTNPDNQISVKIKADCVNEGNFESEVYSKYFKGLVESDRMNRILQFNTYPVPFNDILYIDPAGKIKGEITITIVDMAGRPVIQTSAEAPDRIRLNTAHLAAGTYLLTIKGLEGNWTGKIFK